MPGVRVTVPPAGPGRAGAGPVEADRRRARRIGQAVRGGRRARARPPLGRGVRSDSTDRRPEVPHARVPAGGVWTRPKTALNRLLLPLWPSYLKRDFPFGLLPCIRLFWCSGSAPIRDSETSAPLLFHFAARGRVELNRPVREQKQRDEVGRLRVV